MGQVRSRERRRCLDDRVVVVFKQVGGQGPAGGNDIRFANDTAEFDRGAYRWSTGNTGTAGRFYAKVFKIPRRCGGDLSPTIQVVRQP
jgi:hypothetical protein